MNERLVAAKNGYTVYAGALALHSRYNPALEAEKYVASLGIEKPYGYFILIEPGLDYLERVLRKRFPRSTVISLHCSPFFSSAAGGEKSGGPPAEQGPGTALSWDPSHKKGLEEFLEERLTGADASGIRLIEWRPSINAYGKACLELAGRTVECVRRITANRVTLRNFGRRWLRNGLRNLEILRNPVLPRRGTGPVLICAAGPSLEDALDSAARWKKNSPAAFIIAVSSAAPALLNRGIPPDLVISADGGGWAFFHLIESCRRPAAEPGNGFPAGKNAGTPGTGGPVIASLLSAALPSQLETWPSLILSDGSLWQELLLRSRRVPFLSFPQRGTVSASALDLAFSLTKGGVYIAGLDLSHRDLKTHARPYAFETMMETLSFRRRPFYSQAFERERIIRRGGSHGIYAAWFKTYLSSFPGRIYRLNGEEPGALGAVLPRAASMPGGAGEGGAEGEPERPAFFSPEPAGEGFGGINRKQGVRVLLEALSNPLMETQIVRELGELFFPDEDGGAGAAGKIKEELLALL
ncbi:MAG: DUF115 domain-containing protein [Treponema sp.]|jgi:hypothetical protein|nr:DUF115 domain-containing protein [Treponema sp.]